MATTRDIALWCGGKTEGDGDATVLAAAHDSRSVPDRSVFFCFPGLRTDGSLHALEAVGNGAVAVAGAKRPGGLPSSVPFIRIGGNIRRAYAIASGNLLGRPWEKIPLTGVTGTDGKTSVSSFLWQILNRLGVRTGLSTTVDIDPGTGRRPSPSPNTTPEAWEVWSLVSEAVKNGCGRFALEASSHALSPEYDRLAGARFGSAIYTTITSEHLEFHKTREAYLEAKLSLAKRTDGPVFALLSNPEFASIAEAAGSRLVPVELPRILETGPKGLSYTFSGGTFSLPWPCPFALENAFLAASAASALEHVPLKEIVPMLESLEAPAGRLQTREIAERTVVVDFAHTPDAIGKVLSGLRAAHPESHLTCVFGASGERDREKRPGMGRAAEKRADTIILTEDDPRGEDPETIADEIRSGMEAPGKTRFALPREEAVALAFRLTPPGGTIALLGMGHERQIASNSGKRPYNDMEAAVAAGRMTE